MDERVYGEILLALSNQFLELIICPTEKCNFRCTYCYEDFTHGRMSPQIIEGIKALVRRRLKTLDGLSLSWFGGEPLLAKGIVEHISNFTLEQSKETGARFSSSMTTNGYLLDLVTLQSLHEAGVKFYQITLDGPAAIHDTMRIQSNGRGSFQRIWRNLVSIKESDLEVSILLRIHLSPQNKDTIEEFVAAVRDTFLKDERFDVFIKPVGRWGGARNAKIKTLSGECAADLLKRCLLLLNRGDQAVNNVCYASKPNSLVIRSDGSIAKCTVAFHDGRNRIGKINRDGMLDIDPAALQPWLKGIRTLDQKALGCPFSTLDTAC
jgi:uncharacterized protein